MGFLQGLSWLQPRGTGRLFVLAMSKAKKFAFDSRAELADFSWATESSTLNYTLSTIERFRLYGGRGS